MKEELTRKLGKNIIDLKCSNIYEASDEFFEKGDITKTDVERVRNEPTTEDKNHRLVNILQTKPDDVFYKILSWFKKEGQEGLVKKLAEKDDLDKLDEECKYNFVRKMLIVHTKAKVKCGNT